MNEYTQDSFHPDSEFKVFHVGIIADGSGRWAKNNQKSLLDSYLKSAKITRELLDALFSNGVNVISLYLSSKLNFKRNAEQIDSFCKYGYELCRNVLPTIVNTYDTAVIPVGDQSLLPSYFYDELVRLKELSNSNIQTKLYVVVAYNPIDEIVDAFMRTKDSGNLLESLWVREPLNIVIRTGNANVMSNFLPLQSAYARLYFIDKLFPDITTNEVLNIVHQYRQLNLRYGD